MKRIKLCDRLLPDYTKAEEITNMVTHIVGGGLAILVLVLCLLQSAANSDLCGMVSSAIYGTSMLALYTLSSVYHGMRPGTPKKVLQVLDHCTIYLLIAGTYTPLVLCALRPAHPVIGWGLFFFEWALTALAVTLTAIDLKKYNVFSMICYIGMGWAILPFLPQVQQVLTNNGFLLLLFGGIAYTVGAILYGIGSKKRWFHSVFHLFVLFGSLLQFLSIYLYAL